MDRIYVKLSDGKSVEVRPGSRVEEVVAAAGPKKDIIAAKVDGRPVDLKHILEKDCALEWVAADSPEGLDIIRHSTAHLMAQAVQSLYPGTQVTIGPTIEDGFYYDFKREQAFTAEELEKIEARMEEIARTDLKVTREEMAKSQAVEIFRRMGETYKVAILEEIPDETVSLYRQGERVVLCPRP